MESLLVVAVVAWLAYANGSNDTFKGVATLFGAGITSYRVALLWGIATTLAGSLAAVGLVGGLVETFSGQGIVPDAVAQAPAFAIAVVLGAAATVMLATCTGLPISTTHALVGALVGAGVAGAGAHVSYASLGRRVVAPLIFSPLLAVCLTAMLYLIARRSRVVLGMWREGYAQAGESVVLAPSGTAVAVGALAGQMHFLSAGAMSFARGLNDAPKIAALLLIGGHLQRPLSLATVATAMAAGGLISARRVAETMAHRVTSLTPGQGLMANLVTAALVITASFNGLPVSTTQVSVGSLAGIGTVIHQARWRMLISIGAAWIGTLPVAAALAALTYVLLRSA